MRPGENQTTPTRCALGMVTFASLPLRKVDPAQGRRLSPALGVGVWTECKLRGSSARSKGVTTNRGECDTTCSGSEKKAGV